MTDDEPICRIANQIVNAVGEEPWIRAGSALYSEPSFSKKPYDQDEGLDPKPRCTRRKR